MAGGGVVRAGRVDQDQLVFFLAMFEVPVDALVFEQPGHEVEVGLAVLHAVVPLAVLAEQLEFEVRDRVVFEHRLHDVGHGHVLEDAAVGGAREQPQPRPHRHLVDVVAAFGAALCKAGDVAADLTRGVVTQHGRHGDRLAQQLVGRDVRVGREQRDRHVAEHAQRLAHHARVQAQARLGQGGLDGAGVGRHGH
jgi:hypothetical protein